MFCLFRCAPDGWEIRYRYWHRYRDFDRAYVSSSTTRNGIALREGIDPCRYQSELCEAHKRGRLVSEPLFVGVGIVIAYWYGLCFSNSYDLRSLLSINVGLITV